MITSISFNATQDNEISYYIIWYFAIWQFDKACHFFFIFSKIFSVLLNEWGGGQQLEGVDTKDVLSSLEKGKDQMEPGFGNGQVEDTKEEMIRQDLIIENNDEKAPFSLEDTESVNSQERGLQKEDAKEEIGRNGKNAFPN